MNDCEKSSYLFSVYSRTTRNAAWLESSFSFGMSSPLTFWPLCSLSQWMRKLSLILRRTDAEKVGVIRSGAKAASQREHIHSTAWRFLLKPTGRRTGMQSVSHTPNPYASPVEIKRYHS